jgi:hypothetical protein
MMRIKDTQTRVIINIILAVFALGALAWLLGSCNPVKRVIDNPKHYAEVRDTVIGRGECVNDTLIVSQSDTLVTFDTLYTLDFNTDTYTVDREVVRNVTKVVTKTVTIRDTFTNVVTDNARLNLKQKEVDVLKAKVNTQSEQITQLKEDVRKANNSKRKAWLYLWLIIAGVTLYFTRSLWMGVAGKGLSVIGKVLKGIGR